MVVLDPESCYFPHCNEITKLNLQKKVRGVNYTSFFVVFLLFLVLGETAVEIET